MHLITWCAAAIAIHFADANLKWSDCSTDPNHVIRIHYLDFSPLPMTLPGSIKITVNASNTQPIGDLAIKIAIRRHIFFGTIPVPCLFHVGSCTYNNTCTILDRMVSDNWGGIMGEIAKQLQGMLRAADISSTCPLGPQTFAISGFHLELPKIPSVLKFFAQGDYSFKVTAVDNEDNKKEFMCLAMDLSLR